jgi:hypothetical protein
VKERIVGACGRRRRRMSRVITYDRQNPADHAQILVQDLVAGGVEIVSIAGTVNHQRYEVSQAAAEGHLDQLCPHPDWAKQVTILPSPGAGAVAGGAGS